MAEELVEQWSYDVVDVWRLPYPSGLEAPECMLRGIGPTERLVRRLFPPTGPAFCCWFHDGSWSKASEAAIEIVEAETTKGLAGEELVDAVTARAERIESKWLREAVSGLVDGGEPLHFEGDSGWLRDDRFWIGGRHRAKAMIQQNVRRTVVMRVDLVDVIRE
ncbi:hypothetical protein ADL26_07935 [Thermoactinomyces vulgaris]|nr:hypothetical protein ADL26_07935 [Thermoactinomyces vulgaris]